MEDILDVYELPYDPLHPVVCMDEKPYQLLGEARDSWAMRPGDNKKIDSEYVRNGTCSIFAFIEPHSGRHHASAVPQMPLSTARGATLRTERLNFALTRTTVSGISFPTARIIPKCCCRMISVC